MKPKNFIRYEPYTISRNRKIFGKVVINKYADGSQKFCPKHQQKEKNQNQIGNDKIGDYYEHQFCDNNNGNILKDYDELQNNYYKDQIALNKKWENIKDTIYNEILKQHSYSEEKCINCNKNATFFCNNCGPQAFFCEDNCVHETLNLDVINLQGQFQVEISLCKGLIVYYHLFPGTPTQPTIAFGFEMLDLFNHLFFTANVTYLSFCKVLEQLNFKTMKRKFYYLFIAAFHNYISIHSKIKLDVNKLFNQPEDEFPCPACPNPEEKDANLIIALDGNFQLQRLKTSGNNTIKPLIMNNYICSYEDYEEWIKINKKNNNLKTNSFNDNNGNNQLQCETSFKVADQNHQLLKSKFLDDTDQINKKYKNHNQKIFVLYDVACAFQSYISKPSSVLYNDYGRFNWGVSIFHAYSHTLKCQNTYHPRKIENIGLSDGEGLERIWSILTHFVCNTKYMKSGHRIDILSLAIENIAKEKIEKLLNKFKRAKKIANESSEKIIEIEEKHQITTENIKETIIKQKSTKFVFKAQVDGKEKYFLQLMELWKIRHLLIQKIEIEKLKKKELNLLKKIENCESELEILECDRWDPFNNDYSTYLINFLKRQLNLNIDKLRSLKNEINYKKFCLYNSQHTELLPQGETNYPNASIEIILDNNSEFWKYIDLNLDCDILSGLTMYNAIQNYENKICAEEEMKIIHEEIKRLIKHWTFQQSKILKVINDDKSNTVKLQAGYDFFLKKNLDKVNINLENSKQSLSEILKLNDLINDNLNNEIPIYIYINEEEVRKLLNNELDDTIDDVDNLESLESLENLSFIDD
nr:14504_t:CDS:10 [Entrophospora candida]